MEGRRLPDVYHSQRKFNIGIVAMVEHGPKSSKGLIERAKRVSRRVDRLLRDHYRTPGIHDGEPAVRD